MRSLLAVLINRSKLCLAAGLFCFTANTQAESDSDFLREITINGKIRAHYFTRDYGNSNLATRNAFSLGGQLNVLTGHLLPGLKFGSSVYFAQSLELNSKNPKHVDNTLPGYNIVTLGQAYLQYQNEYLLLKLGNQLIDTPWLDRSDTRIIPMTYQGVYSEITPVKGFKITLLRMFRFKDNVADSFSKTNMYNAHGSSRGGMKGYGHTKNPGTFALGTEYKIGDMTTQAWYYRFYDIANLVYFNANYESSQNVRVKPILGAQVLREWGDGKNLLKPYAGGAANAMGYGVLTGVKIDNTKFTLGYNFIPTNKNSFQQGNVVSPFTDPLYTSSMIAGLIDKAPGHAVKAAATYFALDKRLQLTASHARYFTAPKYPNTAETDFDVTYNFTGAMKGVSVRYRVGVLTGNKSTGRFIYNRLMLQYSF